jgi:hypothetical protein
LQAKHIVLSVLFFKDPNDSGTWIAQALERDIAAFGPDIEQAKRAFERTVSGYLTADVRTTPEPLGCLQAAPIRFWEIWFRVASMTVEAERMPSIPAFMMPVVTYDPIQA